MGALDSFWPALLTLAGLVVPLVIAAAIVEWLTRRRSRTNGR
jgi:hypothetical protein